MVRRPRLTCAVTGVHRGVRAYRLIVTRGDLIGEHMVDVAVPLGRRALKRVLHYLAKASRPPARKRRPHGGKLKGMKNVECKM